VIIRKSVRLEKPAGFTLVELLITIAIVGIMAGVMVTVLNVPDLQNKARDGVKVATLNKLVLALRSHYSVRGSYPLDTGATTLVNYLEGPWPADYSYTSDGSSFVVCVADAIGSYYVYDSSVGQIQENVPCPAGGGGYSWVFVGSGGSPYTCDTECGDLGLSCASSCTACGYASGFYMYAEDDDPPAGWGGCGTGSLDCSTSGTPDPRWERVYCCCGT